MKTTLLTVRRLGLFMALAAPLAGAPVQPGPDFHSRLGLQLWSVRAQLIAHPAHALDLVRGYGVTLVEGAVMADRTPEAFSAMLRSRGLTLVGLHDPYTRFETDLGGIIHEAKATGAEYVISSSLPDKLLPFDEAHVREVAERFNAWGRELAAQGIGFGMHTHGPEFRPLPSGKSAFDLLVALTDPRYVRYEMDVYWVRHAGADPVAVLKAHPGRWLALHLKDMREGAPVGLYDTKSPHTDCVAIGSGAIDWPAVLAAAREVGVRDYFIEDETPDPLTNVPASLAYLRNLTLP